MLHLLLLLSGDRALIRGRPLDVASAADSTRCVHGRGRDSARLLSDLRLSHGGRIELLLGDGPLRAASVVALLRGRGNLKALYEFLVVLSGRALPISYAFHRMLLIISY